MRMKKNKVAGRSVWLVSAAFFTVALVTAGCVNNPGDTRELKRYSAPVKVKTLEETRVSARSEPSVIPVRKIHNTGYVALSDVARAAEIRGAWLKNGAYGVGDQDPQWTFHTADSKATKAGRTVKMPAPAVRESNRLYIPVSGLKSLFAPELKMQSRGDSVSIMPKPMANEAGITGLGLPFSDGHGQLRIASIGSGEADSIIQQAQKYKGVKYEFGTGDYKDTGTFDCSSFTQFLFGNVGITLPRTAREQADVGKSVSRDELEKGDLLFFYVPGRFKTDTTVGHVGIYMGNGQMIHSSPKPEDGVQTSDINTDYWKKTFLSAKRVLS